MVHHNNYIIHAANGFAEYGVRRKRALDLKPFPPGKINGRNNFINFLTTKYPVFSGMADLNRNSNSGLL
jgi:hypothetical protein